MDYKDFETDDFLADEFFVEWVLSPNHDSDHFWKNWIDRYPEKRAEIELSRELVRAIHYHEQFELKPDEYSLIMEKVLGYSESKKAGNRWSSAYVFRIAASIAMIMAVSLVVWLYLGGEPPIDEPKSMVSTTEYGQKKTIYLPDGTTAVLNAGSSIEYPEYFTGSVRNIRFRGEAFFEVAHNPQKPFVIESGSLTTTVLGTSFNLKSFEEEEEASVSVVSGKVKIRSETGKSALLLPNEMGVLNRSIDAIDKRSFDKEKLLAWTHGILIFDNEDIPSIFSKLEKWYGVHISVEEGVILNGKYSGEYKRKSLELVLEGLSYTSNFNYRINQKTVTIYKKKI